MATVIVLGLPLTLVQFDKETGKPHNISMLPNSELQPLRPVYRKKLYIGWECYASEHFPSVTVLNNSHHRLKTVEEDYEPQVYLSE